MDVPERFAVGRGRVARLSAAVAVVVPTGLLETPRALARTVPPNPGEGQIPIPNPAPTQPPGANLMTDILGWLKWGALWAAVAAMLIGAISIGVGHFGSNYGAASAGRKWLLGGIGCAALAALSWSFASTIYSSTS